LHFEREKRHINQRKARRKGSRPLFSPLIPAGNGASVGIGGRERRQDPFLTILPYYLTKTLITHPLLFSKKKDRVSSL
jgi:hypothetical protein